MNASDRLADLYVIRQLILQRLVAGEQRSFNRLIDSISAEIEKMMIGGAPLSSLKVQRLNRAIEELTKIVSVTAPDLSDLAVLEGRFAVGAVGQLGLAATLPSASTLQSIAKTSLIQGSTIGDWFGELQSTTRFDLSRALKLGVSLGETNAEILKRVISQSDRGPEVFAKTRRDGIAIVRTGVQTISNAARQATYEENDDLVTGVQWVSTLDGRTSDICIARSGLVWTLPDFEPKGHSVSWQPPPAHWNCRSTTIPVLPSLEEMGVDPSTIPAQTRASIDGQVAADLTFDDFLKGKPKAFADEMLGKGKAELWRDGKITLQQLLDQRGNPLTLQQLRNRYGDAAPTTARAVRSAATVASPRVNRPAINRLINEETVEVVSRKQAQKLLSEQFSEAAKDARYGVEERIVFRGIKTNDLGRSTLSTGFSDDAMSMILAIKPELDSLAERFNVPKLRAFKTSKATVGSMGDGVMTLHPDYLTGYAANVGTRAASATSNNLSSNITRIRLSLEGQRTRLEDIADELNKVARNTDQFKRLLLERSQLIVSYNRMAAELNSDIKKLRAFNRVNVEPSKWIPGNDPSARPHGIQNYMSNGMDQARSLVYHEFAHHIHQTYGKTVSRNVTLPPIEKRLKDLWIAKTQSSKNRQASKYSTTNEKEWFAENFALYMMDKRQLVDLDLVELIEEMLNEQANR